MLLLAAAAVLLQLPSYAAAAPARVLFLGVTKEGQADAQLSKQIQQRLTRVGDTLIQPRRALSAEQRTCSHKECFTTLAREHQAARVLGVELYSSDDRHSTVVARLFHAASGQLFDRPQVCSRCSQEQVTDLVLATFAQFQSEAQAGSASSDLEDIATPPKTAVPRDIDSLPPPRSTPAPPVSTPAPPPPPATRLPSSSALPAQGALPPVAAAAQLPISEGPREVVLTPARINVIKGLTWGLFALSGATAISLAIANKLVTAERNGMQFADTLTRPAIAAAGIAGATFIVALSVELLLPRGGKPAPGRPLNANLKNPWSSIGCDGCVP